MDNPADMIIVDTDTLDGWQLDWAVAYVIGKEVRLTTKYRALTDGTHDQVTVCTTDGPIIPFTQPTKRRSVTWSPRQDWGQAGPILDQRPWSLPFKTYDQNHRGKYAARTPGELLHYGPTPLIASMRAIVAASHGLKAQVPRIATAGEKS